MSTTAPRHFHEDLADVKAKLLAMSAAAQDALSIAVEALLQRDATRAGDVIAGDARIDAMQVAIEEMVVTLLATQQPMARDLRLLLAALKISNDLERVGDHAVNLAGCAKRLTGAPPIAPEPEIVEMARSAKEMLAQALQAFVRGDGALGREVCRRDDYVDALQRSIFRILLTHMTENPRTISAAIEWFLVSRNLERVADLATNVAEDVVFLVEGKSIKHGVEQAAGGQ